MTLIVVALGVGLIPRNESDQIGLPVPRIERRFRKSYLQKEERLRKNSSNSYPLSSSSTSTQSILFPMFGTSQNGMSEIQSRLLAGGNYWWRKILVAAKEEEILDSEEEITGGGQ